MRDCSWGTTPFSLLSYKDKRWVVGVAFGAYGNTVSSFYFHKDGMSESALENSFPSVISDKATRLAETMQWLSGLWKKSEKMWIRGHSKFADFGKKGFEDCFLVECRFLLRRTGILRFPAYFRVFEAGAGYMRMESRKMHLILFIMTIWGRGLCFGRISGANAVLFESISGRLAWLCDWAEESSTKIPASVTKWLQFWACSKAIPKDVAPEAQGSWFSE